MNANHARPMLAFWVLAAVAALITGLGLRDGGSTVTVRGGAPSPVSRSGSPELVLGGQLRSVPGAQSTGASRMSALSAAAVEYAARQAASARATASADHVSVSAPAARKKQSAPSSVGTRPTTAPGSATTSAGPRPGRGHHHGSGAGSGSGSTTPTAAATTRPTGTPPGKGHQGTPGQGSGGPGKSTGH